MVDSKTLRIGDNLKVIYVGGEVKWFTITSLDDIFYRDAHSALAPAETESYAEVSNLDPPTGQLYYFYRIETECNIKIYLKQPAATNRLGTNKSPEGGLISDIGGLPLAGREVDIWVAEDYPPNVQIVNGSNVSITPILWWIGKRFTVTEKRAIDGKSPFPIYTTVKIGGISD